MTELCCTIYLPPPPHYYHHRIIITSHHHITGIKVNQQRLIYAGKQLDANMTLQHYGIQPSSVIHLILRLLGMVWYDTAWCIVVWCKVR